ncbi:MAG: DUF2335 domain-containing protein [Alphaproteobacteria bacterium]|nr:DUF2335 domain-containing protein [Alphaproteobacteria bacterium]
MSEKTLQPLSNDSAANSNSQNGDDPSGNNVAIVSLDQLIQKLTESLSPLLQDKRNQIPKLKESISLAVVETTVHRGPIPSPQQLGEYEAVLPGAADRILSMAEKEQSNRHRWWHRRLTWDVVISILSLSFGFILSLSLASGAIYCAVIGQPWVAGVLVGSSACGAVATLIRGRHLFGKDDNQAQPLLSADAVKSTKQVTKGKGSKRL